MVRINEWQSGKAKRRERLRIIDHVYRERERPGLDSGFATMVVERDLDGIVWRDTLGKEKSSAYRT